MFEEHIVVEEHMLNAYRDNYTFDFERAYYTYALYNDFKNFENYTNAL